MTTAGGPATYDPRRLPRPSPAWQVDSGCAGVGVGGGRGANLGWPAAAAALNGGSFSHQIISEISSKSFKYIEL